MSWLTAVALGAVLLLSNGRVFADSLTLPIGSAFNGSAPADATPWLIATLDDHGSPGLVMLTLDNSNLSGTEFVSKWYFNLDPNLDPALLTFTEISKTGTFTDPTITASADAYKAGPDGHFDILFDFDTAQAGRFGPGEALTVAISGISTLTANSFNCPAASSTHVTTAHVQGIGSGGAQSGWVTVTVPEPSSVVLAAIALPALACYVCRRRRRSQVASGNDH